jgi:hypothetical protein
LPRPTGEHVAVAARRQDRELCALAFEHGISRHRRAVREPDDAAGHDAEPDDAGEKPLRRVGGRRGHLGDREPAALGVVQHEIREGTADIDAEPQHRPLPLPQNSRETGNFIDFPRRMCVRSIS